MNGQPDTYAGRHLFCFGCGYSARRLARQILTGGGRVSGASRSDAGLRKLAAEGITPWLFDATGPVPAEALAGVTDILVSIPPGPDGDGVLRLHPDLAQQCGSLRWVGLFSTTGVYGDAAGAWIDETFPLAPQTEANRHRVRAEQDWLAFATASGVPVQVFRLPGIYGPHRSPFARLQAGNAQRIVKPGQVFNRIHVDDIAAALRLAMDRPEAGPVFHLADGVPAPADEVLAHAALLVGLPAPPAVHFDDPGLPPMARTFYEECKRLDISRARGELGFAPIHPDYRAGLAAILTRELIDARQDDRKTGTGCPTSPHLPLGPRWRGSHDGEEALCP